MLTGAAIIEMLYQTHLLEQEIKAELNLSVVQSQVIQMSRHLEHHSQTFSSEIQLPALSKK